MEFGIPSQGELDFYANMRKNIKEYNEKTGFDPPRYFNLTDMRILSMMRIRKNLILEGKLTPQGKVISIDIPTLDELRELSKKNPDINKNE